MLVAAAFTIVASALFAPPGFGAAAMPRSRPAEITAQAKPDAGLQLAQRSESAERKGVRGGKPKDAKGGKRGGRRGRGRRRRGPALVTLDKIRRGPVVETVPIYGRLVATQNGDVAARTKGAVATIHVDIGDRVAKGDLLASLVPDMLRSERALKAAELGEYKAKTRTVEVQIKLAQQELKRLKRLRKSAAFSRARYQDKERDVERLKSVLAEAEAKVEQARAELSMADINLAYAEIRAPFPGVVSQRHAEIGAYLNVGAKVVTLVNDNSLEVEAEVPAARLGGLRADTVVNVDPEIGKPFKAVVRAIVPVENALARTRTVRFVPQINGIAIPFANNQSVIVGVPSGAPRTALSVLKDAIVRREGRPSVFVYKESRVELRTVRLGEAFGAHFEVLDGLKPGEWVVIRGNERLRDGQKVRVKNGGPE